MSSSRRIMISVPQNLLQEVDVAVSSVSGSRSEFIRAALRMYLDEKRRLEMRERLRRGYVEMGSLNLALAEGGPVFENCHQVAEVSRR